MSLVPSDTYTLIALGLRSRLVACTEYCGIDGLETVGGTKNADTKRIAELAPDLVIANQEENRKVDIERMRAAGIDVLMSFPKTVLEGLEHAERLAALFPSIDNSQPLRAARDGYERCRARQERVSTFVPIWMKPLMTINHDTFISDCLVLVGGDNVFADEEIRYPKITLEQMVARSPELILLPDEPHEFTPDDAEVFRQSGVNAEIHFCDGKDLMWYGLRSLEGLERLSRLMDDCVKKR